MTREEQLRFCKKCVNRKLDLKQGLICELTGEKADFDPECENFSRDESVPEATYQASGQILDSEAIESLSQNQKDRLLAEQKLVPGLLAGLGVGLIGAVLWALITIATEYQIGYMAVAIGAGVGYSIRLVGKGIQPIFGIWGAFIALLSVFLGNIFGIVGYVSVSEGYDFFELLGEIDFAVLLDIMVESFSPIDIVFYGIATYEGYKFSFRQLNSEDIKEI